MKPTRRWRRMAELYKRFADLSLDFSEQAAEEMFEYETTGRGSLKAGLFLGQTNGYFVGKHWLNVQVDMWREDLRAGLLTVRELLDDGYPAWFLKGALEPCLSALVCSERSSRE